MCTIPNYKSFCKEGASHFKGGAAGEKWGGTGGGRLKEGLVYAKGLSLHHHIIGIPEELMKSNLSRPD